MVTVKQNWLWDKTYFIHWCLSTPHSGLYLYIVGDAVCGEWRGRPPQLHPLQSESGPHTATTARMRTHLLSSCLSIFYFYRYSGCQLGSLPCFSVWVFVFRVEKLQIRCICKFYYHLEIESFNSSIILLLYVQSVHNFKAISYLRPLAAVTPSHSPFLCWDSIVASSRRLRRLPPLLQQLIDLNNIFV